MKKYIKKNIIDSENNRAIKKGLIGNLSVQEVEWCINWWKENGLDENGIRINDGELREPYSGKIIKNKAVIEHIIPISLGGGTTLFNVVPSLSKINSQKHDSDPIKWWISSGYFNKDRFNVFIKFIFESYAKKINEGFFKYNEDIDNELQNEDDFADDPLLREEPKFEDDNNELNLNSGSNKNIYENFLSGLLTILKSVNESEYEKYNTIIEEYEKLGIFSNISKHHQIQSFLFNYIKEIEPSKKYQFVKNVDYDKLIKSIYSDGQIESSLQFRIDSHKKIIEIHSRNTIDFIDFFIKYPNIISIEPIELIEKINVIKTLRYEINPIMLLMNNLYLMEIDNKDISKKLLEIREKIGNEYFEDFIRSNMNLDDDVKILQFIRECDDKRKLTNSSKYDDTIFDWSKNNCKLTITGSSFRLAFLNECWKAQYKYSLSSNFEFSSNLYNLFVTFIFNEYNKNYNLFKNINLTNSLCEEFLANYLSKNNIDDIKIIGKTKQDKINNCRKFIYEIVYTLNIEKYCVLEKIKNEKILRLKEKEIENGFKKVLNHINSISSKKELTNAYIVEYCKSINLSGITPNNGNFIQGLIERMVWYSNENGNQLYVSKKNFSNIIYQLYEKYGNNINYNQDKIKEDIDDFLDIQRKENELNFCEELNFLSSDEKFSIVKKQFYRLVNNNYFLYMFSLQKAIDTKKNEIENYEIEQQLLEEISKENKRRNNYEKLIYHIQYECSSIDDISLNSKDKNSLYNWIMNNINIKDLGLNCIQANGFKQSLREKIRSGASTYLINGKNMKQALITDTINYVNNRLDFNTYPSQNKIKKEIREYLEMVFINYQENETKYGLYNIVGDSLEDKKESLLNLFYKNVDNNSFNYYLELEEKLNQKKEIIDFETKKRYKEKEITKICNYLNNLDVVNYDEIYNYISNPRNNDEEYTNIKLYKKHPQFLDSLCFRMFKGKKIDYEQITNIINLLYSFYVDNNEEFNYEQNINKIADFITNESDKQIIKEILINNKEMILLYFKLNIIVEQKSNNQQYNNKKR